MTDKTSAINAEKKALRKALMESRDGLLPTQRIADEAAILNALFREPGFVSARTVLLTASIGSEIGTQPIIDALRAANRPLVLPRVESGRAELRLKFVDASTHLTRGVWGIMEPPGSAADCDPSSIDLIIVPGLGFDRSGNRLGYGGGYFDRLLAGTRCEKIALAFDCQLVEQLPVELHDQPVPLIITPAEIIRNVR